MKSLIIGMGIGQLYKAVLTELGHDVVTVDSDPAKDADFDHYGFAFAAHGHFDTVHICTPNYTHTEIARHAGKHGTGIVFVEKPGVETANIWQQLWEDFTHTRFMMVKNNMWRDNIDELKKLANRATTVDLLWLNKDRVPNPGTWFTTKQLAFGGVSRDLMPHLLSLYITLNSNWRMDILTGANVKTNWKLEDLTQTDYGIVKADGVYDVDDECGITFTDKWRLSANWRTNSVDCRQIVFNFPDGSIENFQLGLCPEYAYKAMIKDAIDHIADPDFWKDQLYKDLWIHEKIEKL